MAQLIKTIRGNHEVGFGKGLFDDWCVYLKRNGSLKYAPKDIEYFTAFQQLAKVYGDANLYNCFVQFYTLTTKKINNSILELITTISNQFGKDAIEVDIWFTVLYAGMVAEENKARAILKKRVKRLGMHQLLLENKDPEIAASFSKGKKWKELDILMKQKGF
jgi:hypothetical protein